MSGYFRLKEIFARAGRKAVFAVSSAAFIAGCSTTAPVVRNGEEEGTSPVPGAAVPASLPSATTYEESLFAVNFRKSAARGDAVSTMSPHKRLGIYMETFCFKPQSPADFSDHYRKNWSHYPEVAGLTLFGRPLAERAHALGVHYCDLDQLPPGIGGQFLPGVGAVVMPRSDKDLSLPMTLGHEVMHGAQHGHGALNYVRDWDTASRISRTLAVEAAALTVEFMIAYEAKEAGNPKLWDYLQKRFDGAYADKRIYEAIPKAHKEGLERGLAQERALKEAAKGVFHLVLENKDWRRYYLDFELRNFLEDVTSGNLDRENVRALQYGQDRIDRVGLIGAHPSFTEGARLPDIAEVLAAEPKIKWAYEAVEIGRFSRALGKNDAIVEEMRAKALLGGNPYLSLSLADVHRTVDGGGFQETAGKKFFRVDEAFDLLLAATRPAPPALPPNPS